jgi:hypothetical protein
MYFWVIKLCWVTKDGLNVNTRIHSFHGSVEYDWNWSYPVWHFHSYLNQSCEEKFTFNIGPGNFQYLTISIRKLCASKIGNVSCYFWKCYQCSMFPNLEAMSIELCHLKIVADGRTAWQNIFKTYWNNNCYTTLPVHVLLLCGLSSC